MDYVELTLPAASSERAEILEAYLADYPFESFVQEPGRLKAYIPAERLADCKEEVDALLADEGVAGATYVLIESQNWNSLWESNFHPVDVEGRLLVRAPFHAPDPAFALEVVVMPRMAFGTGHHATTRLVAAALLDLPVAGRRGLDMGCGTGVLAIVAAKRGAAAVDAVDLDEWAFRNARENLDRNGVGAVVTPLLGDARLLAGRRYDFILANINRNVLLADMPAYAAALQPGGELLMSGFLERDIPAVEARAREEGLEPEASRLSDGWALVRVRKPEAVR